MLDGSLRALPGGAYEVQREKVDESEGHVVLSRYLQKVIRKALRSLPARNRLECQIALANRIIALLGEMTGDASLDGAALPTDTEMLLAILDRLNLPPDTRASDLLSRPLTRLSQSSLFTGSRTEPSLASELKKEILSSDRIDILMSFIKWSGLRIIADELAAFTERPASRLRIITTTYIGATDIQCIDYLHALRNTEIRVSLDAKRTRLHAKAYLFARDTGFTTAYIGSSNISNPALTSGLEWNLKITAEDAGDIIAKFAGTFETYWNDGEFIRYTPEVRGRVVESLNLGKAPVASGAPFPFDIRPYAFQREILDKLEAERTLHGKFRNLIVSATGTGKTVVAAFDFKRFRQQNPQATFLFIAHRKEILEQSLACFRAVLHDPNFGELYVGAHRPAQGRHLFMSIQTFHSQAFWMHTAPDYYDYVIVDEFHHAEAPSYRRLLEHYRPRILLGLTATPERMDGKDVVEYFDGRIAAEIRLYEAIDRRLLCPFQYFGVTDCVDLARLAWSRGGYVVSELENVYTGNDLRVRLIHDAVRKYLQDVDQVIGLGFCVSVRHAEFMAAAFSRLGIPSAALSGDSDAKTRDGVREQLRNRKIRFIFVVDLYNEGIDIPEVNTVLFLRPTESLTVFLQQLGRGLRLCEGKECLTVLDFIGQAHRNYNFEQRYRALMGQTHQSTQKEIENDFPHLPSGCVVQLERVAREYVLENIRQAIRQRRSSLVNRIATFRADTGRDLTLGNFLETYGLSPYDIYRRGASWSRLCAEAGEIRDFSDPDEAALTKGFGRLLHVNSRRYIDFIATLLKSDPVEPERLTEEERRMLLMFHYGIWQRPLPQLGFSSLAGSVQRIRANPYMTRELMQILGYNHSHIQFLTRPIDLACSCPLDLHCRYTRDEILAAFGLATVEKRVEFREGVKYLEKDKTDLFFITLYKSEKDYSPTTMYEDYAISDTLFHWQSQSTTSETSPTGQRYIHHRKTGNKILLFVRERKKENDFTSPYDFLGPANYVKHEGSRPMSITWELENPMPAHLWKETGKLVVGG
jgi:superfamily II DNA or RNA helicase/HKD family nuclease